jgi:macrolide-specific efflux system membrane fusion protein
MAPTGNRLSDVSQTLDVEWMAGAPVVTRAQSSQRTSMKLKILAIVALGAVGVGAAYVAIGGLPASASTTPQYLTSAAATGDVSKDVAATGTVATTASYGLAFGGPAYLAGGTASSSSGTGGSATWTVKTLKVKVGDTVKKGAVLATADTADLNRQAADARKNVLVAKIQLSNAQDTLDNASGTSALRAARIGLYNAESQLSSATRTWEDLVNQAAFGTLKAPIDGIVTAVNIAAGLDAPSGDAITIESKDLQVTAEVVESDLAAVALGQEASVSISAVDASLTGTVTAIAPTATASSSNGSVVSYAVTVSLKDAPAVVHPGMTSDITITTASVTNVLTVPAAALRGTTGSYTVLVMGDDSQPTAVPVQVGLVTNTTAEIKSGLNAGEMVVTGVNTPQTATSTQNGGGFGPAGGFGGAGGGGVRFRNGN